MDEKTGIPAHEAACAECGQSHGSHRSFCSRAPHLVHPRHFETQDTAGRVKTPERSEKNRIAAADKAKASIAAHEAEAKKTATEAKAENPEA